MTELRDVLREAGIEWMPLHNDYRWPTDDRVIVRRADVERLIAERDEARAALDEIGYAGIFDEFRDVPDAIRQMGQYIREMEERTAGVSGDVPGGARCPSCHADDNSAWLGICSDPWHRDVAAPSPGGGPTASDVASAAGTSPETTADAIAEPFWHDGNLPDPDAENDPTLRDLETICASCGLPHYKDSYQRDCPCSRHIDHSGTTACNAARESDTPRRHSNGDTK